MKQIDRLTLKAVGAIRKDALKLSVVLMDKHGDAYHVRCDLWTGRQGEGSCISFDCASREAALEAIRAVAAEHPSDEGYTIIEDDICDEEPEVIPWPDAD